MRTFFRMGWVVLVLPLGVMAADAPPPASPTPAAPAKGFTLDNWEAYMKSPVAPTRSHAFQGDDGNAPFLKEGIQPPTPPPTFNIKTGATKAPLALKPKPGSNDDRLAAIALEDRDFFQALAKNPDTWPAAERDRRAQTLHDEYWLYIAEYPDDVNAIILYGKLLAHTGQRDAAYGAFMHADALNGKIAVVKQQLGNYLAENGSYKAALEMFRQATALAPDEAIYHYEMGELLAIFYEGFLKDKILDQAALDQTMLTEFARAMTLAPQVRAFVWRHAEAYYDMDDPDWNAALGAWDALAAMTTSEIEQVVICLHRIRILIELRRFAEARELLAQPVPTALEKVRVALQQYLDKAAEPKAPTAPAATALPAAS